ncbi:hypothetical protein RF11_07335 [Thelohanellus kitauei]|uniref:Uncharacterized protein n=1 Tax=Thelohanellus kitauei TaxID=669202 RepID=A0A0C2JEQ2_THEKT|nr:hypothetical protein RF11_07335 [Thelohanellus kitauei]
MGIVKLPSLPDMVFPSNSITIHELLTDCKISFGLLDALKLVNLDPPDIKVSVSAEWQHSQYDFQLILVQKQISSRFITPLIGLLPPHTKEHYMIVQRSN